MQYLVLIWDILKGLGKVALFWRVHEAGKREAELNEFDKDWEALLKADNVRHRLKSDPSYAKRMWDTFKR